MKGAPVRWGRALGLWLYVATSRQTAQNFVEYALFVVIVLAVASIGLTALGNDLSAVFAGLGSKLRLPSGF